MTVFASVDAFWVGTRIGARGLAAVSTAIFWIWMVISLAEMVSVGLTAVAARRHGERRSAEAAHIVGEALVFAIALGAVRRDRRRAVRRPPVCAHATRRPRSPRSGATTCASIFSARRSSTATSPSTRRFARPATRARRSCCCSCPPPARSMLDPVLILGLGGAPRLGIVGAAIALVLTRGGAFMAGLVLSARRGMMRVRTRHVADGALDRACRTADGAHRRHVLVDLRGAHANDDAIRYAGACRVRPRSPRRELAVHRSASDSVPPRRRSSVRTSVPAAIDRARSALDG